VSPRGTAPASRPDARAGQPDRLGGWSGLGFVVALLASEAALTLPDETASAERVAQFYSAHRAVIIVLQVVGFIAAALLAVYAVRLRAVDRTLGNCLFAVAVLSLAPGLLTAVLAATADTGNPESAGRLNQLLPRADDLLFAAILVFGAAVVRLHRTNRWVALLGGLVAALGLLRLIDESITGRGTFDSAAPIAFVVLIATMSVLSLRGRLGVPNPPPAGTRRS